MILQPLCRPHGFPVWEIWDHRDFVQLQGPKQHPGPMILPSLTSIGECDYVDVLDPIIADAKAAD